MELVISVEKKGSFPWHAFVRKDRTRDLPQSKLGKPNQFTTSFELRQTSWKAECGCPISRTIRPESTSPPPTQTSSSSPCFQSSTQKGATHVRTHTWRGARISRTEHAKPEEGHIAIKAFCFKNMPMPMGTSFEHCVVVATPMIHLLHAR